jgi:hypothetical protein
VQQLEQQQQQQQQQQAEGAVLMMGVRDKAQIMQQLSSTLGLSSAAGASATGNASSSSRLLMPETCLLMLSAVKYATLVTDKRALDLN